MGPFWVHFGSILGPFWVHFGPFLIRFGPFLSFTTIFSLILDHVAFRQFLSILDNFKSGNISQLRFYDVIIVNYCIKVYLARTKKEKYIVAVKILFKVSFLLCNTVSLSPITVAACYWRSRSTATKRDRNPIPFASSSYSPTFWLVPRRQKNLPRT